MPAPAPCASTTHAGDCAGARRSPDALRAPTPKVTRRSDVSRWLSDTIFDAAPFGDEEGHRSGDSLHRCEADALVEAMDVLRDRPVAERRNSVIERVDAGIEIAGGHEALELLAGRRAMRFGEHGFGIRARLEHVAFAIEAVEGHAWRIVRQKPIASRKYGDAIGDRARGFVGG